MERKIGRLTLKSTLEEAPNFDNYSKYSWDIYSGKEHITIWRQDICFPFAQAFWSGTEEEILDCLDTILSNMQFEAHRIERFILSHQ